MNKPSLSKHQFKAIKIYKKIMKAHKIAAEDFRINLTRSYEEIFSGEKLDRDTKHILSRLFNTRANRDFIDLNREGEAQLFDMLKILDSKPEQENIIILNDQGDLFYQSKLNKHISFDPNGLQFKIIKKLFQTPGYTKTQLLGAKTNASSKESVQKTIGKINRKFNAQFKPKKNILEGKNPNGYRINPEFKVKYKS